MPRAARNPSGILPADFTPSVKERKPVSPGTLGDRLDNIGTTRSTPLTCVTASMYLRRQEDGEFLADVLGLGETYRKLDRVLTNEPI
jgi:hypothetical protein